MKAERGRARTYRAVTVPGDIELLTCGDTAKVCVRDLRTCGEDWEDEAEAYERSSPGWCHAGLKS